METTTINSPVGPLKLKLDEGFLVKLDFSPRAQVSNCQLPAPLRDVCEQLEGYFNDPAWEFDVKMKNTGTSYQNKVWRALQRIKPGNLVTYGALARKINSAARAIGGACRSNPVPIIVPCHRVVAASSSGGFCGKTSGPAMDIKHWLLEHEAVVA